MKKENKKIRIVFFGTSLFAVPILKSLSKQSWAEIAAVVTTPPKPAGKERKLTPSPVSSEAQSMGLSVYEPKNLKSEDWVKEFGGINPDLAVLASYGKILPQSTLDIPEYGFINVHPSLLSLHRGASPIEGAILGKDSKTGVTIMKMDAQTDHGPILAQAELDMSGNEFANKLEETLSNLGAELLVKTIPSYINGEITPEEQNHDKATFTKLIKREDGRVDLKDYPEEIWRKFRAYHPWPGVWMTIRINHREAGSSANGVRYADRSRGNEELRIKILDVELVNGKIKINKLQPEGKKPMTLAEFERGYEKIL